jgi:hypothetical protein
MPPERGRRGRWRRPEPAGVEPRTAAHYSLLSPGARTVRAPALEAACFHSLEVSIEVLAGRRLQKVGYRGVFHRCIGVHQ